MAERVAEHAMEVADVASALKRIWQSVLGVPVGGADNFLDLGGDSFDAVRIVTRIRGELGCEISLIDLFDRPSIEEFAPVVTQSLALVQHAAAVSAEQDT
jgi:acyl carrier protein